MRSFVLFMAMLCGTASAQILEKDKGLEKRCWKSKWHDRWFCEIFPTPGDTNHVVKYTQSKNFVMREEFIDSVRNGELVHWNLTPSGDTVKVYEVKFEGNKRVGPVKEWHLNGRLKTKGMYEDGRPSGVWTNYLESGIKQAEVKYDDAGNYEQIYSFTIPDSTLNKLDTILKYRVGEELYQNTSILGGNTVNSYGQNFNRFNGRQYYTKEVSINLPTRKGGFVDYTFEVEISTFGQLLTDLDDVIPNCSESEKLCTVLPKEKVMKKKHPGGDKTVTHANLEMYNKKLVWNVRHLIDRQHGVRVFVDARRGRVLFKEFYVPAR